MKEREKQRDEKRQKDKNDKREKARGDTSEGHKKRESASDCMRERDTRRKNTRMAGRSGFSHQPVVKHLWLCDENTERAQKGREKTESCHFTIRNRRH